MASARSTQTRASPLEVAAFVVSIDLEMGWGVHDQGLEAIEGLGPTRAQDERALIASLLDLFRRHHIPATWAVVGHLFLDSCRPVGGVMHPDVFRPDYQWHDGDWLRLDPATDLDTDPLWYGRDVVDMIRAALPLQEIGCHTFSHLLAGDPGCSREAFSSDLAACDAAATSVGVDLRSFVFARNSIGHLDILAAHGYLSYRGHRPRGFDHLGGLKGVVARAIDRARPRPGSAVFPERVSGMWNLPETNFFGPSKRARWMPVAVWTSRQVRRLDLAARTRSLYHLWLHPEDLLAEPELALSSFERVIERAASLREEGLIRTVAMGQLAAELEGSSPGRR